MQGVMVFDATLNNISDISWRVSFIGEGPTCHKSLLAMQDN
jgi:hypothetical protein